MKKKYYEEPQIEVSEMEVESVLCVSDIEDIEPGDEY